MFPFISPSQDCLHPNQRQYTARPRKQPDDRNRSFPCKYDSELPRCCSSGSSLGIAYQDIAPRRWYPLVQGWRHGQVIKYNPSSIGRDCREVGIIVPLHATQSCRQGVQDVVPPAGITVGLYVGILVGVFVAVPSRCESRRGGCSTRWGSWSGVGSVTGFWLVWVYWVETYKTVLESREVVAVSFPRLLQPAVPVHNHFLSFHPSPIKFWQA